MRLSGCQLASKAFNPQSLGLLVCCLHFVSSHPTCFLLIKIRYCFPDCLVSALVTLVLAWGEMSNTNFIPLSPDPSGCLKYLGLFYRSMGSFLQICGFSNIVTHLCVSFLSWSGPISLQQCRKTLDKYGKYMIWWKPRPNIPSNKELVMRDGSNFYSNHAVNLAVGAWEVSRGELDFNQVNKEQMHSAICISNLLALPGDLRWFLFQVFVSSLSISTQWSVCHDQKFMLHYMEK